MTEALAAPTALAGAWLTTYLLHSSVLAGGTWLLTRLARLQPGTRAFLWRMALLGGFVTASISSLARPAPEPHVLRRELGARVMEVRAEFEEATAARWLEARVDEVRVRATTPAWWQALFVLWLIGAGVGWVRLAADRRALRSLRASLTPAGERSADILAGVARGVVLAARVARSPSLAGPCVLPGGTIALPDRCEEGLGDAELRAVLAHELAHVIRNDPTWATVLRALAAVGWLQPLNRLALKEALHAAEEACDDWALARTGERRGLASSISRISEWMAASAERPLPVSMVGRGRRAASARVRRILAGPGPREASWVKALSAVAVAAPLLWVPTVQLPGTSRGALVIETTAVVTRFTSTEAVPAGSTDQPRIFVARIRRE